MVMKEETKENQKNMRAEQIKKIKKD